ncbi:MAG TPA: hypothetical protein VGL86_05680 [Polyangia bacterium]
MAASFLIAAAGACTRDNPTSTSRPGSGGSGATGSTGSTGTGGTGSGGSGGTTAGGNPNGTVPAPVCKVDTDCSSGLICEVGHCVASCDASTNPCQANQTCTGGRCIENGGSSCGTASLVLCNDDTACGQSRVCVGGQCHAACATSTDCPLGQSCASGACTDTAPMTAQCLWDSDCGASFRCVNATCHPLCATDAQCGSKAFCDTGVCRADYRPAG